MRTRKAKAIAALAIAAGFGVSASGQVITQWSFPNTAVAAPYNSPPPTTGTGTATVLGMTNSFTYSDAGHTVGSSTWADIESPGGTNTSGTSVTQFGWRVRGGSGGTAAQYSGPGTANGWNIAAPQYSQGAEFDVSTVGYSNITLGFDWGDTSKGVMDMQVRYNLDITNPSGWQNVTAGMLTTPKSGNVAGGTFGTDLLANNTGWVQGILVDFSGIAGAANDANFGVQLVSDFDHNSADTAVFGTYAAGQPTAPTVYNNSSGNWQFDNVTFQGAVSVPEPVSAGSLGLAGLALLSRRRNQKSK